MGDLVNGEVFDTGHYFGKGKPPDKGHTFTALLKTKVQIYPKKGNEWFSMKELPRLLCVAERALALVSLL